MRQRDILDLLGPIIFGTIVLPGDSFGLQSGGRCSDAVKSRSHGGFSLNKCINPSKPISKQPLFSTKLIESEKNVLVEEVLSPQTIAMNQERHEAAVLGCENLYPWFNFTDADFAEASPSIVESWEAYSHDYENESYDHDLHRPVFPFGLNDLARVSREPLLSQQECQVLIDEADSINENREKEKWIQGGARYGTPSDRVGALMPLERLPKSFELINEKLLPRIFASVVKAFGCCANHPSDLRLGGARVVRYDTASGQVELGMHRDFLALTVNIALNDPTEFEGGGTVVEAFSKTPIRLPRGHALIHPGDVRHAGSSITSGSRYVLVLFLMSKTIIPHDRYLGEWAERCMGLAANSSLDEKEGWLRTAAKYYADAFTMGGRIDRGLFPWFYQRAGLGSSASTDENH